MSEEQMAACVMLPCVGALLALLVLWVRAFGGGSPGGGGSATGDLGTLLLPAAVCS